MKPGANLKERLWISPGALIAVYLAVVPGDDPAAIFIQEILKQPHIRVILYPDGMRAVKLTGSGAANLIALDFGHGHVHDVKPNIDVI